MGDAATDAERAFKKPKATVAELRQALKGLLGEHRLLQQWYKKVVSERDQAYVLTVYNAPELSVRRVQHAAAY